MTQKERLPLHRGAGVRTGHFTTEKGVAVGPTAGLNRDPVRLFSLEPLRLEIVMTTDFQELCLPEIYKYCIEHARIVSFQLTGTLSDGTAEPRALCQDHKTP